MQVATLKVEIKSFMLQVAGWYLKGPSCKLQFEFLSWNMESIKIKVASLNCKLIVASCKFQITSSKLQFASCEL